MAYLGSRELHRGVEKIYSQNSLNALVSNELKRLPCYVAHHRHREVSFVNLRIIKFVLRLSERKASVEMNQAFSSSELTCFN